MIPRRCWPTVVVIAHLLIAPGVAAPRAAVAEQCGEVWTQRGPLPTGNHLAAVAWTGSTLVAVGDGGTIITSRDEGETWASPASGTVMDLSGVVFTGSTFVAVGERGTVLTSPDGASWTPHASGTTRNLFAVAWTGSRLVAVGDYGTVLTSPDGAVWTPRASRTEHALLGVTWTGSRLVAVGGTAREGTVLTSPDGVTWTKRTSNATTFLNAVVSTGSQLVAVGGGATTGAVVTSPDGATWTPRAPATTAHLTSAVWTGTQLVAAGSFGAIATSPDGVTWTPQTSATTNWLAGIVWTGTRLVAVGDFGAVVTSADGTAWTWRGPATVAELRAVTWTGTQLVAVGYGGTIVTSPDGIAWTRQVSPDQNQLNAVVWTGTLLVAVGDAGTVLTSPNGTSWTQQDLGTAVAFTGLCWTGTQLVAVQGDGGIQTSADGITWAAQSTPMPGLRLTSVAWTGSVLVAVADNGWALHSPDGITWTNHIYPGGTILVALAWASTQLVAVGYGSDAILTSPDGLTWARQSIGGASDLTWLNGVAWTGTRSVAVGSSLTAPRARILTSPDGVAWTAQDGGPGHGLYGVAWTGDRLVAVGSYGAIVTSACSPAPGAATSIGAQTAASTSVHEHPTPATAVQGHGPGAADSRTAVAPANPAAGRGSGLGGDPGAHTGAVTAPSSAGSGRGPSPVQPLSALPRPVSETSEAVSASSAAAEISWTTLAGAPIGNEDGPAAGARFSLSDSGLAVDGAGNVYVADSGNFTIRKIAPDGGVVTLAGTGRFGALDGPASAAGFGSPTGVAVDSSGTVYVSEYWGHVIRKVTPDGSVSTLAGSGQEGFADGPATIARLSRPAMLAVDGLGSIYFADQGNQRIRKVSAEGTVTTLAGSGAAGFADGPAATARFDNPWGIALDNAGCIYVSDAGNHRIRKVAADGTVTTVAGSGTPGFADGVGTGAQFHYPMGVAVDASGSVYVLDSWNNRIRRVASDGTVSTLAGSFMGGYVDGAPAEARFSIPTGAALDAAGNLYVTENLNSRVRRVAPDGVVSTLAGSGPAPSQGWLDGAGGEALFFWPSGVAVDAAGNAYVADTWNNRIRRVTPAGTVTTLAGSGEPGCTDGAGSAARFAGPAGVAVADSGSVYVADRENHRIRKVAPDGTVTTLAGGDPGFADGTPSAARFSSPSDVAVDAAGNVLVADRGNHRIRMVARDGTVTTLAGTGAAGFADGPVAVAQLNSPSGVETDASGTVWVADQGNRRIRKILGGNVTTVAGDGGYGSADGPAQAARFAEPRGLAVDGEGDIYVADEWNLRIRKVALDGTVSTVGGNGEAGGNDGTGRFARFRQPSSVAVAPDGTLVVADTGNNAIRVGRAATFSESATIDTGEAPISEARQLGTTGSGATSWTWQVTRRPAGAFAPLSAMDVRAPTFTPDAPGTYVFRLTAVSGAEQRITEVGLVAYRLAAASVSGGATICAGMSATVTADLLGTPPWSVTWSDGEVQTGVLSSPVVRTVTPVATTVYAVTAVSDPHGPGTSTGSAGVTVSGVAPSATITAPVSASPGETSLVASVSDAGPGATYAWTIANGTITSGAGSRSITFSVNDFGGTFLAVTVTAGTCTMSGTLTIPPTPPPQDHVLHFLGGQAAVAPVTPALALAAEFTLEAWVWVNTPMPGSVLVGRFDTQHATALQLSNDGRHLEFVQSAGPLGSAVVTGSTEIAPRTWTHVAGALVGGVATVYVNGNAESSRPSPGPPSESSSPFSLGGWQADWGVLDGLVGALRQVRIWNRGLAEDAIRSVAGRVLTGAEPGLLACWPLDDGSGESARDISPGRPPLTLFRPRFGELPAWWLVGKGGPFFVVDVLQWPATVEDPFSPDPPIGDFYPVDFDSDGLADVVTLGGHGIDSRPVPLFAFRNNGRGGLDDATPTVLGSTAMIGPRDCKAADVNGDGRSDLIIGDQGMDTAPGTGAQSRVLVQSADGRLRDLTASRLPTVNVFTHHVTVADVDGDQLPDAYMSILTGGRLPGELYLNDGSGRFSVRSLELPELSSPWSSGIYSVSACFVNARGQIPVDLMLNYLPVYPEYRERLLLNNGAGHFSLAPESALPLRHGGDLWITPEIVAGNFDGDGWEDLIVSMTDDYRTPFLQLLLNNRDGTFRDASDRIPQGWRIGDPYGSGWIVWISPADFNGDGWTDLLAAGHAGMRLYLSDHGEKFVDATALVPVGPTGFVARPIRLSGGPNPDILVVGAGPTYYVVRNLKPYSLEPPGKVRRGLRGRRP